MGKEHNRVAPGSWAKLAKTPEQIYSCSQQAQTGVLVGGAIMGRWQAVRAISHPFGGVARSVVCQIAVDRERNASVSQPDPAQSQRIADHGSRAQAHGRRSDQGAQEQP